MALFEVEQLTADLDVDEYYEKYVDVEKYLEYCKECSDYATNWSCPPYDFDPNDIWKSYNKLKVFAFKYNFSKELLDETFEEDQLNIFLKRLDRTKVKLMNVIYRMEDENSMGLGMGPCNLCPMCTRSFGMPCKMPFKLRYSIESLGGNVDDMIKEVFDIEVKYPKDGKLPEYLMFVGGLLYDKK